MTPNISTNLTAKAMLVNLTVNGWTATHTDSKVGEEVADAHNASSKAGKYQKHLLSTASMRGINGAVTVLRNTHKYLTLPWTDGGMRILSAKGYFRYVEKMNKNVVDFNEAVEKFLTWYEDRVTIRKEEEARLGTMMDWSLYPSVDELRKKYAAKIQFLPFPSAGDFRTEGIGDEEMNALKSKFQRDFTETMAVGNSAIFERLQEVVQKAADRLKAYHIDAEGKVTKTFRDSLIQNVKDLLEIVPTLNITDNKSVVEFTDRIQKRVNGVLRRSTPG